jgi:hypothetical protein
MPFSALSGTASGTSFILPSSVGVYRDAFGGIRIWAGPFPRPRGPATIFQSTPVCTLMTSRASRRAGHRPGTGPCRPIRAWSRAPDERDAPDRYYGHSPGRKIDVERRGRWEYLGVDGSRPRQKLSERAVCSRHVSRGDITTSGGTQEGLSVELTSRPWRHGWRVRRLSGLLAVRCARMARGRPGRARARTPAGWPGRRRSG